MPKIAEQAVQAYLARENVMQQSIGLNREGEERAKENTGPLSDKVREIKRVGGIIIQPCYQLLHTATSK